MEIMTYMKKPGLRLRHCGREAKEWVRDNWKLHLVDSTALLAASNPIFSALEVNAGRIFQYVPFLRDHTADMSDDMSAFARVTATVLCYGGLGILFSRGRDLSRKITGIGEKAKEITKAIHDSVYLAGFNLVVSPWMYAASQKLAGDEIESAKIIAGTAIAVGFGLVCGAPMGYAVDAFRDFTGVMKNDRVPFSLSNLETSVRKVDSKIWFPFSDYICEKLDSASNYFRNATIGTKRKIAAATVGGLVALNCGVYTLTEDKLFGDKNQAPVAQQVAEISEVRVQDGDLEKSLLGVGNES